MSRVRLWIWRAAGIGTFLLSPLFASATLNDAPPDTIVTTQGASGVLTLIGTASGWFLGILIALAVILIMIGAYNYLFSEGNEEKLTLAKNYVLYALVAVAIGLLARGLVLLIGYFFDNPIAP